MHFDKPSGLGFCAAGLALACVFERISSKATDATETVLFATAFVVLVAAATHLIRFAETRRCEMIRTCYLGNDVVLNPEAGELSIGESRSPVDAMAIVLSSLSYGSLETDVAVDERFEIEVRTHEFAGGGAVWSGEIFFMRDDDAEPVSFESKIELAWMLAERRVNQASAEKGKAPVKSACTTI
jgi:hypothetical protein